MLILEPVIETFGTRGFARWPVAAVVLRRIADGPPREAGSLLRGIIGTECLITPAAPNRESKHHSGEIIKARRVAEDGAIVHLDSQSPSSGGAATPYVRW